MSDLSPKKIQKVLRKIEEMADVFLNSANFVKHTFLTLAPPSCYALNLKANWSRCQKLTETLSFHMKYLDLHLKENLIRQTSFLRKNPSQKPESFRVNIGFTPDSLQIWSFVCFLTASNHVIVGWNYGFVPFGPF